LIAFYEVDVELAWKGELKHNDTTTKVRGKVKMPYISDENDYNEFDITCTIDDSYKSKEAAEIRSIMAKEGLPVIKELVAVKFVKELRAGAHVMDKFNGWEKDYLTYKDDSPVTPQQKNQTSTSPAPVTTSAPKIESKRTHTLTLRERFTLPVQLLFDFFTDASKIGSYTRAAAKFDRKEGGKFEMVGGVISGEVVEIKPNEKLVLKWRMRDWADDVYSTVTLTFEQQGGGETLLTLEQTNIPHQDKQGNAVLSKVEEGWKERFFRSIKLLTGQLMGSTPF
jgi:activator of HSP90 ATPase